MKLCRGVQASGDDLGLPAKIDRHSSRGHVCSQGTRPVKSVGVEVRARHAAGPEGLVHLLDSVRDGPPRPEAGHLLRETTAVDAVRAPIGAVARFKLHATGHQLMEEFGQLAKAVIVFGPPDVEGAVVDQLSRGSQNGLECATNVLHVDKGPPRQTVSAKDDASGRRDIGH
jgi:hypothetical protein